MIFRTLRSRLTLSFLGIALVAVLTRSMALAILQKFYPNLEYFGENTEAIGMLASTLAVLIAAVVGWYISRLISAPVSALKNLITRTAKGDLSRCINLESRDEFDQLWLAFSEITAQVEKTAMSRQRFVADAAHELHTPLTALQMNLDLALDENNAADRTPLLLRGREIVKRLEGLVTNLLELERLEANGDRSRQIIIDLTELLRDRVEIWASQAEQAELLFEADLPEMPVLIRGDVSQIMRAMNQLVNNACKFTQQAGSICIMLSEKKEQTIFSIIDTGIGIPADDLPQLFSHFHRGRNAMSFPGSGLGLAIVKAIAIAHAAQVEVHSAGEGKGSRFTIRFPPVAPEHI
ncbi:MAG: HAMP domain-containing sensor histidine kinase [Chloroflexota bacterium]